MSEMWERGEHPAQAETHDPIETEFAIDEYLDTTYEVTISTRESVGAPDEAELQRAIYQGVRGIDDADAVRVERL